MAPPKAKKPPQKAFVFVANTHMLARQTEIESCRRWAARIAAGSMRRGGKDKA